MSSCLEFKATSDVLRFPGRNGLSGLCLHSSYPTSLSLFLNSSWSMSTSSLSLFLYTSWFSRLIFTSRQNQEKNHCLLQYSQFAFVYPGYPLTLSRHCHTVSTMHQHTEGECEQNRDYHHHFFKQQIARNSLFGPIVPVVDPNGVRSN